MKTFTPDELKAVLAQHTLWLSSYYKEGARAYLIDADLRGAYLRDADLRDADLRDANLCRANLIDADLRGADLRGAYLRGAYLRSADLRGAYLRGANLCRAYLRGADLRGANLRGANLIDANLSDADLSGADLSGANLIDANLRGADLRGASLRGASLCRAYLEGAKLPAFSCCPQEGEFIAFKKLAGGVIAKLKIPAEAGRTSSLVGRKCRAEFVTVLGMTHPDGSPIEHAVSMHDKAVEYMTGEIVRPDSFDPDIRVECTNGIHFFVTLEEAQEY